MEQAFSETYQIESCFFSESFREASQFLEKTIEKGLNTSLITGPSGSGKTFLIKHIQTKFSKQKNFWVLKIDKPVETSPELVSAIKRKLPIKILTKLDRVHHLNELWQTLHEYKWRIVVFFDNAHLLSEGIIRRCFQLSSFTNIEQTSLQFLFCGNELELEANVRNILLERGNLIHINLLPLTEEESQNFVQLQLDLLNKEQSDIFYHSDFRKIQQLDPRTPGKINIFCRELISRREGKTAKIIKQKPVNQEFPSTPPSSSKKSRTLYFTAGVITISLLALFASYFLINSNTLSEIDTIAQQPTSHTRANTTIDENVLSVPSVDSKQEQSKVLHQQEMILDTTSSHEQVLLNVEGITRSALIAEVNQEQNNINLSAPPSVEEDQDILFQPEQNVLGASEKNTTNRLEKNTDGTQSDVANTVGKNSSKENQKDLTLKSNATLAKQTSKHQTQAIIKESFTLPTRLDPLPTVPQEEIEHLFSLLKVNQLDKLERLLTSNNINSRSQLNNTLLIESIKTSNYEALELLLSKKANPNLTDLQKESPLILAIWQSDQKMIEMIVEAGTNLEYKNQFGWTALTVASINGQLNTVKKLLANGANLNATAKDGKTALMAAIWNKHMGLAEYLILQGANINLRSNDGWTALSYAAWHGNLPLVQSLILRGAKLNVLDNKQQTPQMIAKEQQHYHVYDYLREQ